MASVTALSLNHRMDNVICALMLPLSLAGDFAESTTAPGRAASLATDAFNPRRAGADPQSQKKISVRIGMLPGGRTAWQHSNRVSIGSPWWIYLKRPVQAFF